MAWDTMARRRALALGFLVLGAIWAERWTWRRAPARPAPTCAPWYGVRADGVLTWHADPAAVARAAAGCTDLYMPAVGDIIEIERRWGGCTTRGRRASARDQLALGWPLSVNEVSEAALRAVPGIGPATAAAIVAARPFERLLDLERVRGIGPVRRRRLSPHLTVTRPQPPWPGCRPPGA